MEKVRPLAELAAHDVIRKVDEPAKVTLPEVAGPKRPGPSTDNIPELITNPPVKRLFVARVVTPVPLTITRTAPVPLFVMAEFTSNPPDP
jgi:hypothetical protein